MKNKFFRMAPALVLALGAAASFGIAAYAQTPVVVPDGATAGAATGDIIFPVAELGNCKNQGECREFCDKKENIRACVSFAERRGMVSAERAARARQFAEALAGQAPGGCASRDECERYCENPAHMEECVAFAEKHNFIGKNALEQARRLIQVLKKGKNLPGGCRDKASCEAYCSNSDHSQECLNFAEAAGILSGEELVQARRIAPLIKAGKSPGGCKTKEECRTYCSAAGHFSECIAFARDAGLINKEEAELAGKTGGKGPGGCASRDECERYCNVPENTETCFNFARERGIISAEKQKEIEAGMGRLRAGLGQMPAEVLNCLKEKLGEGVSAKIQNGTFVPGPAVGEAVKGCVAGFSDQVQERFGAAIKTATPQIRECLRSGGIDESVLRAIENGDAPRPEAADIMRRCFEAAKQEGATKLRAGLAKMPAQMRQCIESKLGADTLAKIQAGQNAEISPEQGQVVEQCAQDTAQIIRGQVGEKLIQAPPEVRDCIESKLGGSLEEAIKAGKISGPEVIQGIIGQCMAGRKIPQGAGQGPSLGPIPDSGRNPNQSNRAGGAPSSDFRKGDLNPGDSPIFVPNRGENRPQGDTPDMSQICPQFAAAPSCDFIPEGQARELCRKCRGQ